MALTSSYSLTTVQPSFRTNTSTSYDQYSPDVLGLSNGGFVAAYNNDNTIGADFILLNFYDANGGVIGTSENPYEGSPGTIGVGQPSLTQLTNGNVLVVWDDNYATNAGVRGHLYAADGTPIGSELGLGFNTNNTQITEPQVAALAGGRFVISFSFNGDVRCASYDSAGTIEPFGSRQVNTVATTGNQLAPAVTALADGGFVVTYQDDNPPSPEFADIRAVIYNANETVRKADFLIDGGGGPQFVPRVAALPNGDFAVVYMDYGWADEGGTSAITLRFLDSNGSSINYVRVNHTSPAVSEADPDITVLANGFIVVTWTRPDEGAPSTDRDIFARVFDQSGDPISINGLASEFPIRFTSNDEIRSAVSHLLGGQFITTWQDSQSDGSGGQITSSVTEITRTTTGDAADDTFVGDQLHDVVDGGGGNDVLSGNGGNDDLTGGIGVDSLYGGDGDDTLDGGTGADIMVGGAGDDVYFVDNAGDVVTENANEGNDTVNAGVSYALTPNVETLLLYGSADLQGYGNNLANVIVGNTGNNLLDGGVGADTMSGGAGNDVYFADNIGDQALENANEGNDTVFSTVNFTLSANVENLILQGSADLQGYGNGSANVLYGNTGSNLLNGFGGVDLMAGGAGDDVYFVDNPSDSAFEVANQGNDSVFASCSYGLAADVENLILQGAGDFQAYGNNQANVIYGNSGNNLINAGGGIDLMAGGAGNDIYYVDDPSDACFEVANQGNDSVFATCSYGLAADVENLILQGSGDFQAYGSGQANTIYGNSGSNLINGGGGADLMAGGAGGDVYFVDNAGDGILENANEGNDSVFAGVSYALSANVEGLVLQGAGNIDGLGNTLANSIVGNAGNNTLDGGGSADQLTGGGGNDTFVFHAGQANGDTVVDFNGNGGTAGDSLQFIGYGAGATFTNIDATHWQVNYNGGASHDIITFSNGAPIDLSDYSFV